jgi:4-amino-4-deoxy-L-arabinose transferase-like glycosyltransferase
MPSLDRHVGSIWIQRPLGYIWVLISTSLTAFFLVTLLFIAEALGIREDQHALFILIIVTVFVIMLPVSRFIHSWSLSRRREKEWFDEEIRKANWLFEDE